MMVSALTGAVIGIDIDNTLVSYDRLFRELAVTAGLVPAQFRGSKQAVRDAVRRSADGDLAWRRLQARAYGAAINGAAIADGALSFVRSARSQGARIVLVSHKTRYSNLGTESIDLRQAALTLLFERGVIAPDTISAADVYFEPTREAKIARIAGLACTHFIDDLEEVLRDRAFPPAVERLLLTADGRTLAAPLRGFASFAQIAHALGCA